MRLSIFLLLCTLQHVLAQYYVVNYPQQAQQYYIQPQYQQVYQPQPQFIKQQPQFPQQNFIPQPQVQYIQQQPQQQYQPQPQPQFQRVPQPQQYQPQPQQQYQQPQSQQQYQPQQQQYQQQVAQPVIQQPQQTERTVIDTTINDKNVKIVSANTYEFDLPPPPPSRFLPEEERVKIIQANKQGRPEHTKVVRPHRPHTRVNNERKQEFSLPAQNRLSNNDSHQKPQVVSTVAPTTTTLATTTVAPTLVPETNDRVSHLSPNKGVNPNKVFLQCCKNKKVAKSCESRCNFDNINKKVLTAMFLGTDPCPQSYGLDLFACAAQDSDHTPCCRTKNVQRTSAGEKCLAFCNLRPDSNFQADASYLPCWAVLNDVRSCFKEAILEGDQQ